MRHREPRKRWVEWHFLRDWCRGSGYGRVRIDGRRWTRRADGSCGSRRRLLHM